MTFRQFDNWCKNRDLTVAIHCISGDWSCTLTAANRYSRGESTNLSNAVIAATDDYTRKARATRTLGETPANVCPDCHTPIYNGTCPNCA